MTTATFSTAEICKELTALQRQRRWFIKSRIMIHNRLRATIAGEKLNYNSNDKSLSEDDRSALFSEADLYISEALEQLEAGKNHELATMLIPTWQAISGYKKAETDLEKNIVKAVSYLPDNLLSWLHHTDQNGFGDKSLGVLIGETGDLCNYSNPGKVWKRLGLAPINFHGKSQMGATWRKTGGLSSEEWEKAGYSPRRRSVIYVISENLLKQNYVRKEKVLISTGPYRLRYDEAKAKAVANRPEWTTCHKCDGEGAYKSKESGKMVKCGCKGKPMLKRCHLHGMLLMTKLLVKNLWIEWNGHPPMPKQTW